LTLLNNVSSLLLGIVDASIQVKVVGSSPRESISLLLRLLWLLDNLLLLLNNSRLSIVSIVVIKSSIRLLNRLGFIDQAERFRYASSTIISISITSLVGIISIIRITSISRRCSTILAVHLDDVIYLIITFACKK
jgi:hypothetical protein